jgi:gliding motility-associated-like protein
MKRLAKLFIFLLVVLFSKKSTAQSDCPNMDFSSGTFQNWTTYMGTYAFSGMSQGFDPYRFQIHGAGGTIPNTNGSVPWVPDGYEYVAQVGNFVNGSQADMISYDWTVTAERAGLEVKLAAVLEDDGHPPDEQPRLVFKLVNAQGAVIPCSEYVVIAGGNVSGWVEDGIIEYLPWVTIGMDLTDYIGQTLTIQVGAMDCTNDGHFGTGFVTCKCVPSEVDARYCEGENNTTHLSSPLGYSEYLWSTGETTSEIDVPYPVNGQTGWVQLTSFNGCVLQLNYTLNPSGAASQFTVVNDCQDAIFESTSTADNGFVDQLLWSTSDGGSGEGSIFSYSFPDPGDYAVQLVALNDVPCHDTTEMNIHIFSRPVASVVESKNHWCLGQYSDFESDSYNPDGGSVTQQWILDGNFLSNDIQVDTLFDQIGYHLLQLVVVNEHNCIDTLDIPIHIVEMHIDDVILSAFNGFQISCSGENDGQIQVEASGGAGDYFYEINGGPSSLDEIFYSLYADDYVVTVTDSVGCTADSVVVLNEPAALSISPTISSNYNGFNVTCFDAEDGSLFADISGGVPGYALWLDNVSILPLEEITALAGGNHTLELTDANGCVLQEIVNLLEPSAIQSNVAAIEPYHFFAVSCPWANDGGAVIQPSGGTNSFSCHWSDGALGTQSTLANPEGWIFVTIVDSNGCTEQDSVFLDAPDSLFVYPPVISDFNGVPNPCNGDSLATISLSTTGGADPISFEWSNGLNNGYIFGLTEGFYDVVVSDANGCQEFNLTVDIIDPEPLVNYIGSISDYNGYQLRCKYEHDGFATVGATGGVEPFTFYWTPLNFFGDSMNNLFEGTYECLNTDANGCQDIITVELLAPELLNVEVLNMKTDTCMRSLGHCEVGPIGGVGPFQYLWQTGHTGPVQDSLMGVNQLLTIVDANLCQRIVTVQVPNIDAPIAKFITEEYCENQSAYFGELVSGQYDDGHQGMPNIWHWDFGDGNTSSDKNPTQVYTQAGNYYVTLMVNNEFDCASDTTVEIYVHEGVFIYIPNSFTPNGDGINDVFEPSILGCEEFELEIYSRWGDKIFSAKDERIIWNGSADNGSYYVENGMYFGRLTYRAFCDGEIGVKEFNVAMIR